MRFKSFSPKQVTVLSWWDCESPYGDMEGIICDGAVRSGKTICMSLSFVGWAMATFDNQNFALCAKTINSLRRNVVQPLVNMLVELGFECSEKISKNILEISYGKITNRFYLFGGRDEQSASLIQGVTLAGIFLDEVALMPRSFVEQALARCSITSSKFWFNCNPEHPYHWFYKEWIQKSKEKKILYLHFTMDDNPSLTPQIKSRYNNLYSGTFYRRFVQGKWTAAEGLVYPHMAELSSFEDVPKEDFQQWYISCDYGTVNPTSMGLWGRVGERWYRVKEYYYDSKVHGIRLTDEQYYTQLEKLAGDRDIVGVVVDPSAASFMQVIRNHGKFSVMPAKNDVIDGIRMVSDCLREKSIVICNTCSDAMREFSLYFWDEKQGKDIPKKENDHAMDEIRYFVSTVHKSEDSFFVVASPRKFKS